MREEDDPPWQAHAHLTEAERCVLHALWEHRTPEAVAVYLHLSVNTVNTHLRNIREKIGVHSTLEAVALFEHHLLDEERG